MPDYIMDMIEQFSDTILKAILGKEAEREYNDGEIFIAELEYEKDEYIVKALVTRLLGENKINEAENVLFNAIDETPSKTLLYLATDFYKKVAKYSDKDLKKYGYSREEIKEGVDDIKKIYKNL